MHTLHLHPTALVESNAIGARTRIWAFAHILPNAVIGEDCNICDHVFIEGNVRVGSRVTIKSGVQLCDVVTLEDDVFVGPNATFAEDTFSRHAQRPKPFPQTLVKQGASIGANATILSGITVGARAIVGAGAVVTHDVPPRAIVVGNPAQVVGYDGVTRRTGPPTGGAGDDIASRIRPLAVGRARLLGLPIIADTRGALTFGEIERHLPFLVQRYFVVFDVPGAAVRGEHAHKALDAFMVCLKGSCSVMLDDGVARDEVVLDTPAVGLYLPRMVWSVQYRYSRDAVLLVLASDKYKADDYIRDYDTFLAAVAERK